MVRIAAWCIGISSMYFCTRSNTLLLEITGEFGDEKCLYIFDAVVIIVSWNIPFNFYNTDLYPTLVSAFLTNLTPRLLSFLLLIKPHHNPLSNYQPPVFLLF